ncbi:MAG: hypothetical protein Q7S57_01370 [bacterium]|nr:hypothetical protein [bacterium]
MPIEKMKKAEIMEEYESLKQRYDELQMLANVAYDPKNQEVLGKTKEQTTEQISKSVGELKTGIETTIVDLEKKLLAEAQRLSEMQKAIEVSRAVLETQYNVQVGADALKKIIEEAEKKKHELEADIAQKKLALETEIQNQKRDWTREQEEFEYATKLKQKRTDTQVSEELTQKEKSLAEREVALKTRETELVTLQKQAEEFPKNLEKQLAEKEKAVGFIVRNEQGAIMNTARKEWDSAKAIQDLKIQHLQEKSVEQEGIITKLQQDLKQASAQAQELAVTVIRHGAVSSTSEEKPALERQKTIGL